MARLTTDVAGSAGVFFVGAELSRRGLCVLPTIRNTQGVDLLVSEPNGGRMVTIQVKTTQGPQKKWVMNAKCESLEAPTLFYVLVNLGLPGTTPEFHVIHSSKLAKLVRDGYADWLRTPGKKGQARNDTTMRAFFDPDLVHKDKWSVLGLNMVP